MAQPQGQDFDSLLGALLLDLNENGVPDVLEGQPRVPMPQETQPSGVQVAQLGYDVSGGAGAPRWLKALGMLGAAAGADRLIRGEDSVVSQLGASKNNPPIAVPQQDAVDHGVFFNQLLQPRSSDVNATDQGYAGRADRLVMAGNRAEQRPSFFEDPPASVASKRGGVLDMLNLPQTPPPAPPPRNVLMDVLNQAAGLVDYYGMGIPSTFAGLVNAAIPGRPLGGLQEAKASAAQAQRDLGSHNLGRDLMAMPGAFAGMGPYSVSVGGIPRAGGRVAGANRAVEYDEAPQWYAIQQGRRDQLQAENARFSTPALPDYRGELPPVATTRADMVPQGPGFVRRTNDPESIAIQRGGVNRARQQGEEYRRAQQAEDKAAQQAPTRQRNEATDRISSILDELIPAYQGSYNPRGNMVGLINDVSEIAGVPPWQVIRAMTEKGYDLSGLSRASFQSPRQSGRLAPMDDETRALWDMVRYDNDVLYRQRGAPYEPQPRNALMDKKKPGDRN